MTGADPAPAAGSDFWRTAPADDRSGSERFPLLSRALRQRPLFASRRTMLTVDVLAGLALLWAFSVFFTPELVFSRTTATGGDTGAHIYSPWHLKEHLLPEGRITGWSHDWYAGFPFLHFYFPLVITLQALLGYVIPYEIAFKIGTIIGTFFLPIAFYIFFRLLRCPWPTPLIGAFCATGFLFMDSFNIYGGNIPSSFAGEYSFSVSLGLCIVFYGLAYRLVVDERPRPLLAAFVLAAAVLSHLVPVIMVVATFPLLFAWSVRLRGATSSLVRLGVPALVAFCLTAWWSIPFVARLGYTTNMRWAGEVGFGVLFPDDLWLFVAGAALGLAAGVVRKDPRFLLIVWPGVIGAAAYLWLPDGHIWNGRFVPFWYLGVYAAAAYGVGTLIPSAARAISRRRTEIVAVVASAALALTGVVWLATHKDHSFIDAWIELNFEGYEGTQDYDVFRDLNAALEDLPRGRVMWEPSSELGRFGTPIALMALPYFAGQPTMEGIYFESSITTPYLFIMASELAQAPSNPIRDLPYNTLDLERGLQHMELFDVSYYVAFSDAAVEAAEASDGLEELDVVERFHIYGVKKQGRVVVAPNEPAVYAGDRWFEETTRWFADGDLETLYVKDGPSDWSRVSDVEEISPQPIDADAEVSDVRFDDTTISFSTDAVGQPHLVKTSYFPNWRAEGADGPYHASPSLMMVVPTQTNVILSYRWTWAEWVGYSLTFAVLVLIIVWPLRRRIRRLGRA